MVRGDLLELVHQGRLGLEAARGVGEHDVDAALLGLLNRVENHRAGSAPSLPFTTSQPTRLPHTSSCCTAAARNVSPAASRTVLAFGLQLRRELADGRRLADAVDARP